MVGVVFIMKFITKVRFCECLFSVVKRRCQDLVLYHLVFCHHYHHHACWIHNHAGDQVGLVIFVQSLDECFFVNWLKTLQSERKMILNLRKGKLTLFELQNFKLAWRAFIKIFVNRAPTGFQFSPFALKCVICEWQFSSFFVILSDKLVKFGVISRETI